MLKLMKQMLSLLCVTAVCCLMIPSGIALAATSGDYTYTVLEDGTAKITKYHGAETELVVPSSLDGYDVTIIGFGAVSANTSIESVVISDGVTMIDAMAFDYCTSLKHIAIPKSVTESIAGSAFSNCTALEAVEVDEENSAYCDVDGVLFSKDKTTLVYYPTGKKGVYSIPNDVENIGKSAFYGCPYLTSVTLSDSVTSIGQQAFSGCTALESVSIPDGVTVIDKKSFYNCSSLQSIVIPDSVTCIGQQAFSECASLANISIGKNVSEIGSNAFEGTAYINNADNWNNNVLYIGEYLIKATGDLRGCYTVRTGTTMIATKAFYDCDTLTDIVLPNSLRTIGERAFENCSFLKTVVIPDGMVRIEEYAFYKCTLLLWALIPDSVTAIDDTAFDRCGSVGIYGYAGSHAQQFASNHNIFFYPALKPSEIGDLNGDGILGVNDVAKLLYSNIAFESYYKGDVNNDWMVSTTDARTILTDVLIADDVVYNAVADFDQNGIVNTSDAREVVIDVINEVAPTLVTPPAAVVTGVPAGEAITFTEVTAVSMQGDDTQNDGCYVIQSLDELKAFYADDEGFEDYTVSFTEDFFRTTALVLVKVTASETRREFSVIDIVKSSDNALTVAVYERYEKDAEPIIHSDRILLSISKADLTDVTEVRIYTQTEIEYELL